MKIGVMLFYDKINRGGRDNSFSKLPYYGFRHILSQLPCEYDIINISQIKNYDYVLCSLTSVMDVENMVYVFETHKPDKGKCKIIVGGFGCINIFPIYDYIDIAVFGRAEDQIRGILDGESFPNVWRKDNDEEVSGKYIVGQAKYLLPEETMVGCRNKCLFCQYSWTRHYTGKGSYDAINAKFSEDDWRGLSLLESGRKITAWDGLCEDTRGKVNKPVSDNQILEKLQEIYTGSRQKAINLKIFNIVGYPWETAESVDLDLSNIKKLFGKADLRKSGAGNRLLVMLMFTPFSPEPMTPMSKEKCNIEIIWRDYFGKRGRQVYKGVDIEAFVLPQINSSYTLAKRVMINRCTMKDRKYIQNVLKNKKIDGQRSAEQIKSLRAYNGFPMWMFDKINHDPVPYLTMGGK